MSKKVADAITYYWFFRLFIIVMPLFFIFTACSDWEEQRQANRKAYLGIVEQGDTKEDPFEVELEEVLFSYWDDEAHKTAYEKYDDKWIKVTGNAYRLIGDAVNKYRPWNDKFKLKDDERDLSARIYVRVADGVQEPEHVQDGDLVTLVGKYDISHYDFNLHDAFFVEE